MATGCMPSAQELDAAGRWIGRGRMMGAKNISSGNRWTLQQLDAMIDLFATPGLSVTERETRIANSPLLSGPTVPTMRALPSGPCMVGVSDD